MNKKRSYLSRYLSTEPHILAVGMAAVGTVAITFPLGGVGLLLGLLATAAIETVSSLIIPSLPSFQQWADEKDRRESFDNTVARLQQEIMAHGGGTEYADRFDSMQARVASLYSMADDSSSTLTRFDVTRLEDATLDYLRLCLSYVATDSNKERDQKEITTLRSKLREFQSSLEDPEASTEEKLQLQRAAGEVQGALKRFGRMSNRRSVIEASLIAMPVRLEEMYQMVMTSPRGDNLGSLLEDSISKLKITEEVSRELDGDFSRTTFTPSATPIAPVTTKKPVPIRRSIG